MNLQIIKQIPFFSHLDEKQLKIVAESFSLKKFKKDDTVMQQGNEGFGMHVIIAGKVDVERDGKKIANLGENDYFGEMALVSDEPRSATIKVTSEDLVTFFLSKVVFRGIRKSLSEEVKNEILKRHMEDYGYNYTAPFKFF